MKITIAGAGEIGIYLARMLNQSNHDIIIIDNNKKKLIEIASSFDLLTINGSATSFETLTEANVAKADLFIAVTKTQETNITASILAKNLGAKKTIARIDNKEYLVKKNKTFMQNLGIDSMVYPEILASKQIINLLQNRHLTRSFDFASGRLSLLSLHIDNKSPFKDKELITLAQEFPHLKARIVAITRGNETIIPRGLDKIQLNDTIYVVTTHAGSEKIIKISKVKNHNFKNTMILGGSRIGVKTAKALEKNCFVKLIEKEKDKSLFIADKLDETLILNDEGRTSDFLLQEGIEKTDVFIAVTGNSEINILSCLLAKKLGARTTIAEVENNDYLKLAKNMGIDIMINKKLIAASHIYAHTTNAEVVNVQCLTETDAEVMEFIVHKNSKITKKPLKNIKFPNKAIIGGIVRNNESLIAVGSTQVEPNDIVVVFTVPEQINSVAKFFK